MKFFSPTSELKELLLLEHIEKTPNTTQKEIAEIINGAASMVNVYVDNLEKKTTYIETINPQKQYAIKLHLKALKGKTI